MTLLQKYPLLVGRYRTMINRCYTKHNKSYKDYGALGVTVCEEWLDKSTGIESYINWALSIMDYGDMAGLQIDKDVGSARLGVYPPVYSPATCSFLTRSSNMRSTRLLRTDNTSGYRGVHKTSGPNWAAEVRVNGKLIHLGHYVDPLDAAKAYDYYITITGLEHTINNVLVDGETVVNITTKGYTNPNKNTSNYFGVCFDRSRSKWKAHPKLSDGYKFLGRFATELEAHNAVQLYLSTKQ